MKRKTTIPVMWISLPNNTLACAFSSIQCNGYLLLPAAGYRNNSSGAGTNRGSYGDYWSVDTDGKRSRRLSLGAYGIDVNADCRSYGFSVRCVQEFTEVIYKNNPGKLIMKCITNNETI